MVVIGGASAGTGAGTGTGAGADPGMANIEGIGIAVADGILTEEMGIGIPTETGATSRLAAIAAVTGATGVDTLAAAVAEGVWKAPSWLKNL